MGSPMAVRMYRRFLPRVRRTADIHEVWPDLQEWASLRGKVDKKGMSYDKAKREAMGEKGVGSVFRKHDKNSDGALSAAELRSAFSSDGANILGFHDLDEDGQVTREEFAEVFGLWAGTAKAVFDDTPKAFRKYQLKDMGELNIEDLPAKVTKQMEDSSRKLEQERLEKFQA